MKKDLLTTGWNFSSSTPKRHIMARRIFFPLMSGILVIILLHIISMAGEYYAVARLHQIKNAFNRLPPHVVQLQNWQKQVQQIQQQTVVFQQLTQAPSSPIVPLLKGLLGKIPNGIYLESMRRDKQQVWLSGNAQTQYQVHQFVSMLETIRLFRKPQLQQISAQLNNPPYQWQFQISALVGDTA